MTLIVMCAVILLLLLGNEVWVRRYGLHSEFSRKRIHMLVGSLVAFWPFLLTLDQIRLMSVTFLFGVVISKYFHIFKAIHSVTRPTWGEVSFALAVGLTTLITHNKWVYAVALLQMSLADGLAAVIGVRYGAGNDYKVFQERKSLAGTVTFMVVSYLILLSYGVFITPLSWVACLGMAAVATGLENIALRGLDNLLVPLFVAAVLRALS